MRPTTLTKKAPAVSAAQGFVEQKLNDSFHCADTGADLPIMTIKDEARIDSRLLAESLGVQHRNLIELLTAHRDDFAKFAKLTFQTEASPGSRTGQSVKFAQLTEDQSYLLLTYSRNTARVRGLKVRLVKVFSAARCAAELRRVEYLPGYHQLHDAVQARAAGSANERFVHMNVNKLVNRTAGLDAGERKAAAAPVLATVILAQTLAATAMRNATDHHDGFARAKAALGALQGLLGVEALR